MFKVNNKDSYFTLCSSVSIVNFENVITGWDRNEISPVAKFHYVSTTFYPVTSLDVTLADFSANFPNKLSNLSSSASSFTEVISHYL